MVSKRLLIAASFCFSLPTVSLADVFPCPPKAKIKMVKSSHNDHASNIYWEASLKELPKGMPTLFKGARFTSNGVFGENKELSDSDMPITLFFAGATYNMGSNFEYGCNYKTKSHKDLAVTLNLSENYLSVSNKMPMLIEPYGQHWEPLGENKVCTGTAKQCSFHLPQYAVRARAEAEIPAQNAFRLTVNKVKGNAVVANNVTINATNETQHHFFSGSHFKATHPTDIKLFDLKTPVDIEYFLKAREGKPRSTNADECKVDSGEIVECSCSSDNLMLSFNSNGHTMVDLFAVYDENNAASKVRCSLFNVPASTDEHEPHEHEHDEH